MPCAVCRVACLAWNLRIGDIKRPASWPRRLALSPLEIFSAKEAKRRLDCGGKHLGCPGRTCPRDRVRIAVRTKWQSGSGVGNAPIAALMGNRLIGNERQPRGKTSPYLSRKIYSFCCRCKKNRSLFDSAVVHQGDAVRKTACAYERWLTGEKALYIKRTRLSF
jgi:hypothetical protein